MLTLHTEDLNETIQEFEELLNGLGYMISSQVEIQGERVLVYKKKRSGEFGLFVEDLDGGNRSPLRSCSRETRIRATSRFRVLHQALKIELVTETHRVESCVAGVRKLNEELREEAEDD